MFLSAGVRKRWFSIRGRHSCSPCLSSYGFGLTRLIYATPPLAVFAVTVKYRVLPEAVSVQSSGVVPLKKVLFVMQDAGVVKVASLS